MSRTQALSSAIISGMLTVGCLLLHLGACFVPFLISAIVFSLIVHSKHRRDLRIIHEAEEHHHLAARLPAVKPPMSSQGSDRLFVPPPLEH